MDTADDATPPVREWPRASPAILLGGAALGVLGRDLPVDIAASFARGSALTCGDRSILECALDNLDELVAALFRFALAMVVIGVAGLVVGTTLVLVGRARRQPVIVALGIAVLVPVVWHVVATGWSVLT